MVLVQQQASNPKYNVYLSASAGTGKTKTLIDRILRLLLNGTKIDKILCLTFTNVATNEVLERLKNKLEEWFFMNDKQLSLNIKALTGEKITNKKLKYAKELYNIYLENFDKFRIETLHAFCIKALKQAHYIDENESDQIEIIDDYTKRELIGKAYDKTIKLSNTKKEIDIAINRLGQKYDYNTLLELLNNLLSQKQKLYNLINSQTSIQNLINEEYRFYRADKNISSENITDSFIQEEAVNDFPKVLFEEEEKTVQIINAWLKGNAQFRKDNLSEYLNCFLTKSMTPRMYPFNKDFRNRNSDFMKSYRKEQQRIIAFLKKKTVQEQAEFMQYLIIFLNQVTYEYEKLKQGYLEHDDLILKTLDLFNNTNDVETLLFSLNLSISHILIDEAQDLSKTQWLLINKIIAGITGADDTIFIVGDYKQSIYGFQGAEPQYFFEINERYKAKFHKEQKPWKHLRLTHSFRSKKEILKAVDKIFATKFEYHSNHIATKEGVGKIKVIEYSYKEPEKIKQTGWLLPQKDEEIINKKKHNSQELAGFIIHLLNSEAKPEDIMVLFRKRSERITYLVERLREQNIPVSEVNKIDFKQNLLILDLLSLVKFFLLPEDDLNLAGLLKSPFFNFTENDIFKITYNRGKKNVWNMLQTFHPDTAILLLKFKDEYENNSLYQFYTNLLYTHKFALSIKYDENCHEAVELFLDKVLEFEKQYQKRGQFFLNWISNNSQITVENNNTQGINVITIHGAKGLQSPIVIIADASDSENLPVDTYFWYDDRLIVPYSSQYGIDALTQVKEAKNKKIGQESLRLFYVAMTRAENELYIFGNVNSRKNSWYSIAKDLLPDNFIQYSQLSKEKYEFNVPSKRKESNKLPDFLKEDYQPDGIIQQHIASEREQLHSDSAVIEGNFIHKILHDIPKIPEQKRALYIQNLANTSEFEAIPSGDINNIINITDEIIRKFPNIFYGDNILSEVNIKSRVEGNAISAKIDKLIINENYIDIIEVKTDKAKKITAGAIPAEYKKQLAIYRQCVALVYPNKKINCKILSFYQQDLLGMLNEA